MIKVLKILEIIDASFLNCIAMFFLISLFLKIDPNVVKLVGKITVVTIAVMIILEIKQRKQFSKHRKKLRWN